MMQRLQYVIIDYSPAIADLTDRKASRSKFFAQGGGHAANILIRHPRKKR
jgi:hypothetical protein